LISRTLLRISLSYIRKFSKLLITKKSKALSWKTGRSGFLNSTSRLQKPESGSFFSVLEMLKKSFTYI
jgi:hypothetical protein